MFQVQDDISEMCVEVGVAGEIRIYVAWWMAVISAESFRQTK